MHSVLCMSPFSLNSERKVVRKQEKKIAAAFSGLLHLLVNALITLACKDGGDPLWCQLPSG